MLDDIINFLEISPSLGTAGQPEREQFAEICSAGYTVVINLATSSSLDALADEADLVRGLGMQYIAIPVIWDAPTAEDVEHFFAAMQNCQGQKVLVHCARNMRVSSFVYLYRVLRLGQPEESARADLLRIWQPNPLWQALIDALLR